MGDGMRLNSEKAPLVIVGLAAVLVHLFSSMYQDVLKSVVVGWISHWLGIPETEFMSRIIESASAFLLAAAVIWLIYRYLDRALRHTSLAFVRRAPEPVGDFGDYTAYVIVKNTSLTEKLHDCRCEIVELRNADGDVIETNVGLRTKGQETKEKQGRFNLDQDSTKNIPVFRLDQSDENGLSIVNANEWDLNYDHGIYTARIRGYGDRGEPDEITVRIDSRTGDFQIIQ
jgi:hypothetical protein